jgi:hypothetical protein
MPGLLFPVATASSGKAPDRWQVSKAVTVAEEADVYDLRSSRDIQPYSPKDLG